MAALVPLIINTIFNVLIFKYVRASTRRLQPQNIDINTTSNNNQQPIISRREISLLKQMILMFCAFIGGWTPACSVIIIEQLITLNPLYLQCSLKIFEIAMLAITINFFICDHEMKEYLINKIRQLVRR
jgi:hypothetical protein